MKVVFDSSALLLLLHPDAKAPQNPETSEPIDDAKERMEYLVKELERKEQTVLIPTPVLSEILVKADKAGSEYLKTLEKTYKFKIVDFDKRAAIEVAELARQDPSKSDPNDEKATRAKLKFDRQILGIAKVNGAKTIYTNDKRFSERAKKEKIRTIGIAELPLPPEDPQQSLGFAETSEDT